MRRWASVAVVVAIGLLSAEWKHHHAQHPLPKVVALTFDDGPHPIFTPQILDILKGYGVRATFFLIGERAERYPELARRIVAEGHEIGNHTYSHPADLPRRDWEAIRQEIAKGAEAIERVTGVRPKLFRPPRGYLNYRVHTAAQLEGLTVVLWTVSADHHDAPTPEAMAQRVLKAVHPGAIILMHDGRVPIRWKDVKALPLILDRLRRCGYRFVTVSELLSRNLSPVQGGKSDGVPGHRTAAPRPLSGQRG
ncbi:Peptidoglycan-N-acetylglucosamine deacetylase [bacterium HR17]|jgi:peptidoglycan/xylan/chitin deacetylase (PgdA/CDA1 family)|uniref:Peptidoglycan-N-acetylglucosamine deacetylase n=1 Tax=Candidatus Fervidibacter japonicus TaxID=2035412 RepID=A0A2H5XB64_9BACT|nr:Peptidoglycan-N-acetylglucosamine deacetylase [bacterium HR17]